MIAPDRTRRWWTAWTVGLGLIVLLAGPARGQNSAKEDRRQTRPPKLSESRGDATTPPKDKDKDKDKEPAPAVPPKGDAEPKPLGFFGDTTKFSKIGGWGSFGSAMGQFGMAKATLIMMPPIQEELKLTDDQKGKLRDWQASLRKKGEEMGRAMREKAGADPFQGGDAVPITARITQFTTMMDQLGGFMKENEAGLARILNPAQRKRLNQVALQMEGIAALTRPEIVEALGMDEEEEQAIRQILAQSRMMQMTSWVGSMVAMRPARRPSAPNAKADPNANPDPNANANTKPADDDPKAKLEREKAMRKGFETMRDRTDQIQERTVKEILTVLSRAQRAKFEILLGPPFDPKKLNDLGRPPGRPGTAPATKPDEPGAAPKRP